MKKITLAMILVFIFTTVGVGAAPKEEEKEPQWEVVIKIKYNAISRRDALGIVGDILRENENACTVSVNVKKVGESNIITFTTPDHSDWIITDTDGTDFTTTENK